MIAEAERMAARSLSFEGALQELGTLLHRLALLQAVPEAVAEDDPDREVLSELAALFGADELQLYYQIVLQGRADIGLAPDEYAGFTMTLLRLLAFAPAGDASKGAPAATSPARPVKAQSGPVAAKTPDAGTAGGNASKQTWDEIVNRLGLTGMARMLAQHCELRRHDGTRMELCVAKAHERLLDRPYQDKLKAALAQHFGDALQVVFSVGEGSGNSPAEVAGRNRQHLQAQAIADIEQDPFVRELVENFDARVIDSTIKPIQSEDKR